MKDFSTIVAASVLSADFAYMADGVARAERAGTDWLHLDVMDGSFVPNMTFGPKMVADIARIAHVPLDVHLMIDNPGRHIQAFIEAGSDHVTFHIEAAVHAHRVITQIKDLGAKAGISIVPSTPASSLEEVLTEVDIVLVMTVNPGFGGQKLIPRCLDKIRALAAIRDEQGFDFRIAVDGGINRDTVADVRSAGADVLISGSAFFGADDPESEIQFFKGDAPNR